MAIQIIITAPDAPTAVRVGHAIGKRFGLVDVDGAQRDATLAEVTQIVRKWLWGMVMAVEKEEVAPVPLTLT